MNSKQINKKEPYYVTTDNVILMPPEQTLQKARNDKYLKALQTLAERDPEGFSNVAPELIKRSVWNWRAQTLSLLNAFRIGLIPPINGANSRKSFQKTPTCLDEKQ